MTKTSVALVLSTAFLVLWSGRSALAEQVVEPLVYEFAYDMDQILLSDDGKVLVVCHLDQNRVSIFDTVALKVIQELEVERPGQLLIRKDRLYVSEQETGYLKVFAIDDGWKFVDEIDSGLKSIDLLSAPLDPFFQDIILASSSLSVTWVNVSEDTSTQVSDDYRRAVFSWNGEEVIALDSFRAQRFEARGFLSGSEPLETARFQGNFKIWQMSDKGTWFSNRKLTARRLPDGSSMEYDWVIADSNVSSERCFIYDRNEETISTHRVDGNFTKEGAVKVKDLSRSSYRYSRGFAHSENDEVTIYAGSRGDELRIYKFPLVSGASADGLSSFSKKLPTADTYEIVNGPEGLVVREGGTLEWADGATAEPGEYPVKIRMESSGVLSFHRDIVSVLQSENRSARGDAEIFIPRDSEFSRSEEEGGIIISSAEKWMEVDATGKVTEEISLPRDYLKILRGAEGGGFLALKSDRVDFLSEDGQSVEKSLDTGALQPLDVISEAPKTSFLVATKDPASADLRTMYPVIRVDRGREDFERIPRVFGKSLFRGIDGNSLYASISHVEHGPMFSLSVDRIDLLMKYSNSGHAWMLQSGVVLPTHEVHSLAQTADGRFLGIGTGASIINGNYHAEASPVYSVSDLEVPVDFIPTGMSSLSLDAHPFLPVFASITNVEEDSQKRPTITLSGPDGTSFNHWIEKIPECWNGSDICFSGDGRSIFIKAELKLGKQVLKKIDLSLSEAELKTIEAGRPDLTSMKGSRGELTLMKGNADGKTSPSPDAGSAGGLRKWDYIRLAKKSDEEMPSHMIPLFLGPSVALVEGSDGAVGTGFFVSAHGHVITAAHCVPSFGSPMVYFEQSVPYEKIRIGARAHVVDLDDERDLALLKIDVNMLLPTVGISRNPAVQGEKVYVIGHPGIAEMSLENTLTSGIVSSAGRKIAGQNLLQISAPVNPGNSGGPVFDRYGQVVGMVSMKADLEGTGFAVPCAEIVSFLRRTLIEEETEDIVGPLIKAGLKRIHEQGFSAISDFSWKQYTGDPRTRAVDPETEEPFTGTIALLNPSGEISQKLNFLDGFADGKLEVYDPSGKTIRMETFEKGIKHGPRADFFESGNPKLTEMIANGLNHGPQRHYADRKNAVIKMVHFAKGEASGPMYEMDDLSRVVFSAFVQNGEMVTSTQKNYRDREPKDFMTELARGGDIWMIHDLVREGESINRKPGTDGPIHAAVQIGYDYLVEDLIDLQADLNLPGNENLRPLEIALGKSSSSKNIVKLLLEAGANTEGIPAEKLAPFRESNE